MKQARPNSLVPTAGCRRTAMGRLLLMTLLLFAFIGGARADEVTIGDGTATSNTNPIGTYYNYSITELLYTADEIGMAGTINSVSFYYAGTTAKDFPIKVYMKHVDATDLSSEGISLADADEVFYGTFSVTGEGWATIDLDAPFTYDGTSNLLIGINKAYAQWYSDGNWYHTTTTVTMARYSQNDDNAYDTSTVPGTAQTGRPNIQIEITSGSGSTCAKPSTFSVSNITATGADFEWEDAGADSYTFEYKKTIDSEWTVVTGLNSNSYALSALSSGTAYNARVKAVCGVDSESGYKSASFTTPFVIPLVEEFNSAPSGWSRCYGLLSSVMNGTATLSSTSSGWGFGTINGVFDNHAAVYIDDTDCASWLVTPTLPMEDNVQLTFDLALTAYSGTVQAPATTGADDKFAVLITTDGGSTWTVLRQWDNAGSQYVYNNIACSATGQNVAIDLSSYVGKNVAIAFYGESTANNADNILHIDNVSIDYIPACAKPTALAATLTPGNGTIATLS